MTNIYDCFKNGAKYRAVLFTMHVESHQTAHALKMIDKKCDTVYSLETYI